MRVAACCGLVALVCCGPAAFLAHSAGNSPLGVVETSQNGNLDGLSAVAGSDFYGGEEFVTYQAGQMQLRVHQCRIDLGALTNARFMPDATPDHLLLIQGSARFSCPKGAALLIDTPAGIVHGNAGEAASGMIVVTDPRDLIISAYDEGLILDNDGELHIISPGQSYRIAVKEESASAEGGGGEPIPAANGHRRRKKIVMTLIIGGATFYATSEIWCELRESPSKPERDDCW